MSCKLATRIEKAEVIGGPCYAIQIEHSNRGDTNSLLLRQQKSDNWLICAEAVIGNC